MNTTKRFVALTLMAGCAAASCWPVIAEDLAGRFLNPPEEARPLTWWHWLDGTITRQGITADWESIKRAGLGGAYLFNCGVGMPTGDVKFMQPEWLGMMDHTIKEAGRLGLKFGVHNCDGFSQSGGPWITPETSMKELTWTTKDVQGPITFDAMLAKPHENEDFYRDIAVVAFPLPQGGTLTGATLHGSLASAQLAKLTDGTPQTRATFPVPSGSNVVEFVFAEPRAVRSVVCRHTGPHKWEDDFPIQLEVSSDGIAFRPIAQFTANWDMFAGSHVTAACEEANGKVFRLWFKNSWSVSFGELELSDAAQVHFAEAKAARLRSRGHGAERRHYDAYPGPDRGRALVPELVVARSTVKNITTQMAADGRLKWDVPPGRWRIVRLGFTSNGHYVSPATPEGRGLECDKLDAKVVRQHLDQYVGKLLQRAGPAAGRTFAAMEVDSWECGIQNWTAGFEQRFRERLGYDLLAFVPALLEGWIVDNADVTERALWDWRRFLADQFSESYFGVVARWAEEKKITFVGEPNGRQAFLYDVGHMRQPAVTMGEFWLDRGSSQGVRVDNKIASSLAHTTGKRIVAAEAYTASPQAARWQNHPFSLKAQGDRAFCAGVNQFVFHTFAHQPYRVTGPGFTFASWGLNFNRANTWWDDARPWMDYLTRCNYILREGQPVSDVLWFVGEDVPNRIAWRDELHPALPEGYDFDGCDAQALLGARFEKGRIMLASGTEYRVLLLPDMDTMRPAVLKKVAELARAGATVLGPRPRQSPSLRDLSEGDATVRKLAEELWNGRVASGATFEQLFQRLNLPPDFEWRSSASDAEVLYIHRRVGGAEVYFVSNQRNRFEEITARFRVSDRAPELWDPATGTNTRPAVFRADSGRMHVPLRLEPFGSVFVVFRDPLPKRYAVEVGSIRSANQAAAPATSPVQTTVESAQETFTLSVWVKPEQEIPLPAERRAAVAFQGQNWAIYPQPGHQTFGTGHAGAGIAAGRNGICVFEHSARYAPAVITYPVEIKDWTHVAVVYEQRVPRLFFNGKEVRRGTKGPHVVHASVPKSGAGPKFNGQSSSPQLFNQVLGTAEIAALVAAAPNELPAKSEVELELAADGTLSARCWDTNGCSVTLNDGSHSTLKPVRAPANLHVAGPWTVRFAPGLGAPASAQFERLISWSEHAEPGIRYFSGAATYGRKGVLIPAELLAADRELHLDLGQVAVIAEVKLNGERLGTLWKPPFRVRLDRAARAGANDLEIRVVNLWPNRMIGDAFLPDDIQWNDPGRRGAYPAKWPDWLVQSQPRPSGRFAFCTRKDVYAKDDPLLPSGLLGPVILRTAERLTVR